MWAQAERRVFAVSDVEFRVTDGPWAFADANREAILAHWALRQAANPAFFNGVVHVLAGYAVDEAERLSGHFLRTDFMSFLYWRETGHRDKSVMDAFGAALIQAADGRVLLGRQREGNLNGGLCYPPAGFIDARDIEPDGHLDIGASVTREVVEETGLLPPVLRRRPGYVVVLAGPVLSVAVPFQSDLDGPGLREEALKHVANDPASELVDFVLATPGERLELPMPDYAATLLAHLPEVKTRA